MSYQSFEMFRVTSYLIILCVSHVQWLTVSSSSFECQQFILKRQCWQETMKSFLVYQLHFTICAADIFTLI